MRNRVTRARHPGYGSGVHLRTFRFGCDSGPLARVTLLFDFVCGVFFQALLVVFYLLYLYESPMTWLATLPQANLHTNLYQVSEVRSNSGASW